MTTDTTVSDTTAALRAHLGAGFTGTTTGPDDPTYDDARRVWNATVDKRPALVALCTSPADVAAAVRAAREVGVPLSVRGGGHQVAGLSVCEGLVIDLAGLRCGEVDVAKRRARVGGGSLLGDVDRLTQKHGLIAPAGVVSHTGLGGLVLGGGLGWTVRHFGLTCDNMVGAELVTAAGEIIRADDVEDPELLWALRGGGGNFGVVTTFELALHEVTDVLFGRAVFALDDADRAAAHYRDVMLSAPKQLTAVLVLRCAPDLPSVPHELVGRPALLINAVWSGDLEQGDSLVRGLTQAAGPATSSLTVLPYLTLQSMHDENHPHGQYNYLKSRYLTKLDAGAIETMAAAAAASPSVDSQIEVVRMGGAIAEVAADATAFSGRDAAFIVNISATWSDPAETDENIQWARELYAALDRVGSDAGYVNFLGDEPERVRSVYSGTTYERLRQIKARVDPENIFRGNVAIAPADPAERTVDSKQAEGLLFTT